MKAELEKIFDAFLEGELDDSSLKYLEEIKEESPEEYQEFLELVAFEERVNQELKEQRSGDLLADVIIKEIRKSETKENIELADNVLKRLRETPSKKIRKIPTTKRRVKKQKKSGVTPWLVAAMITISFGLGVMIFQSQKSKSQEGLFLSLVSGEVSEKGQVYFSGSKLGLSGSFDVKKEAKFLLSDGTEIRALEGSKVEFSLNSQKEISLHKGFIHAKVARQESGTIIFKTALAHAEILGTEFDFEYKENRSRLKLKEGKVKFTSVKTLESKIMTSGDELIVIDNGDMGKSYSNKIECITLVDGNTGKDLKVLSQNETISLAQFPKKINIKFSLDKTQPLRFMINGRLEDKSENNPPYFLTGNDPGTMDINNWEVRPGTYNIEIRFLGNGGKVNFTETLKLKVVP